MMSQNFIDKSMNISRPVARTLVRGDVYSYIHALSDIFLSKLINLNLMLKKTRPTGNGPEYIHKYIHTYIQLKAKSDIRRSTNSFNVVAFFPSIEMLFHKADALY